MIAEDAVCWLVGSVRERVDGMGLGVEGWRATDGLALVSGVLASKRGEGQLCGMDISDVTGSQGGE